jgi:hypothetical protein
MQLASDVEKVIEKPNCFPTSVVTSAHFIQEFNVAVSTANKKLLERLETMMKAVRIFVF